MERTLMVTQRSSLVPGHITVESKRSGLVARTLLACGFAVATLSLQTAVQASHHGKHQDQASKASEHQASVSSGPKSNPDKKADAKAAREKKKADKAAQKAEKLAKAKASKKGDHGDGEKVAKADSKQMNDDMGGSDDPLEGL
jgi:hypothetical protein